ncbi:MAG: carbon-nitrogen hydrolase family protein [Candidatus Eremiobacteraeota bacterium]|nr:carbon-nitrogen hydrolase family protein [Candidatus Eremiobacteraeota bacterium]
MTRSIRIAALQLRAHDHSAFAGAADAAIDAVAEAANGAELVVLPESTFPAYVLGDVRVDHDAVDAAVERLRELSRRTRTVIVAGVAMRVGAAVRNAAIVIDRDGSIAGRADKLFLWHFDRRWFEQGEQLAPVPTSLGRLGVLICADGRIPTIARTLVDRGAEMLVMPTAWVTSGRDPNALENVQADLLARVRAFENGVPFIAANKCGSELGMVAYCGKSQILDAAGMPIAIASQTEPETLKAVVETGAGRPHRAQPAHPTPRATVAERPLRIGFSFDPLPSDIDARLALLDDAYALAPENHDRIAALDRVVPTAVVGDELALDPAGLVAYRRAGYRLFVWSTAGADSQWTERIARARALELRLYGIVFDRPNRRAYAVDPDGAVIAGTFGGFVLASFLLDPRRTMETAVAPGTDITDGLERIASIVIREDRIQS